MARREALTRRVLELGLWGPRPLVLLDVGASGGVENRWDVFGGHLRAVGFDPLVAEVDRLNASETRPGVRYEAAFVGCPAFDELLPPSLRNDRLASKSNDPFTRVSAAAAQQQLQTSYVQEVFNAGAAVVMSDRRVSLDEWMAPAEYECVDFVKVDTDGHDIEVLLGAERLMDAGGGLGVMVEAQFHGGIHDCANTFANIDRLMRLRGYTLFDIAPNRYSRTALPAPFQYDLAAQTVSGQVLWGDAVYFRDLADPVYEQMWPCRITAERVLKLACLYEQFDLPDCAAELLVNRGGFLEPARREELLDLLASGEAGGYARLRAAFTEDFRSLYPSRLSRETSVEGSRRETRDGGSSDDRQLVARLRARTAALKTKIARLTERLQSRDRKIARLVERVRRLEAERTVPR